MWNQVQPPSAHPLHRVLWGRLEVRYYLYLAGALLFDGLTLWRGTEPLLWRGVICLLVLALSAGLAVKIGGLGGDEWCWEGLSYLCGALRVPGTPAPLASEARSLAEAEAEDTTYATPAAPWYERQEGAGEPSGAGTPVARTHPRQPSQRAAAAREELTPWAARLAKATRAWMEAQAAGEHETGGKEGELAATARPPKSAVEARTLGLAWDARFGAYDAGGRFLLDQPLPLPPVALAWNQTENGEEEYLPRPWSANARRGSPPGAAKPAPHILPWPATATSVRRRVANG